MILPEGAYISNASVTINEEAHWGKILKQHQAESEFTTSIEKGITSVIISEITTRNFLVKVNKVMEESESFKIILNQ